MDYKKFNNKYVVRLDKGEELVEELKKFCKDQKIKLGSISGLGATDKITIGLFDVKDKKFHSKEFLGAYEIASLIGNISTMNKEIYLHLHITIGDKEHKTYSGHLVKAVISATFEGVIDMIDGEIDRQFSDEVGLNLMKFG